ncbi:MAG: rhodanese-like domain-containing protein [Burkholderiales bacterium]|nr:rhodanese-like domain-containing protein [Burkholderiales bacterium]
MTRASIFAMTLIAASAVAADDFADVRNAAAVDGVVIIDSRPIGDCRAKTLAGARCLPAADLLGPHRRLPDARNLLWLLGTLGLAGDEQVLVVGQDVVARDFVAGLLHVAGQRSIAVLTEPVGRLLEGGAATGAGRERGMIREKVYVTPMRDDLLVLRDELVRMHPLPMLLDGRTDAEYWGETARASRAGHLPGAVSLPALHLRSALNPSAAQPPLPDVRDVRPVAYAHDPMEGLAYLTLLVAGHGVPVRLYAEGWAEWAADGALPADAQSFPERATRNAGPEVASRVDVAPRVDFMRPETALAAAFLLVLVVAAFVLGRRTARRRTA